MKKFYCFICLLFLSGGIFAQRLTPQQYVEKFKDLAISEMHRTGVPASIKLAQGILESESGNGNLVKRSNNHFGIKCKSYWEGEKVYHDDDERGECFRKYDDPKDSYRDHSDFLRGSERYASLFKLKKTDYKGWAHGLKKAGYATNPRYAQILIWQIDKYNLHQYDLMPDNSSNLAANEDAPAPDAPTIPVVQVSNEVKNDAYDLNAVTKRNGLKAIYATAGTSLLAIATKHDIPLSRLLEFNDMSEDGLLEDDEWIYLERKNKMASQEFHIAEEGDTYYYISQSHGVQYSKLIEYNGVKDDEYLSAGQKVWLRPVADVAASSTIVHQVQPKEGLFSIARKYNVSVDDIRKLNKLDSDVLQIGQQLIISK